MGKLLAAVYGSRYSRRRAFLTGVARLASPEPRLSISVYIEHVQERAGRIRSSPSAAFVQSARHFDAAESSKDELAIAR